MLLSQFVPLSPYTTVSASLLSISASLFLLQIVSSVPFFLDSMGACMLINYPSVMSSYATQWTVAHQALLPMVFSRQEYWNGLPCLPQGDLTQGSNPHLIYLKPASHMSSALQEGSLPLVPSGKPLDPT